MTVWLFIVVGGTAIVSVVSLAVVGYLARRGRGGSAPTNSVVQTEESLVSVVRRGDGHVDKRRH